MKRKIGRLVVRVAWWLLVAANIYLVFGLITATLFSNLDRFYAAVVCAALLWGVVSFLRWVHQNAPMFAATPSGEASEEATVIFHGDSAAIARLAETLTAEGYEFTQTPEPSGSSQQSDTGKWSIITPSGDRKEVWL